METVLSSVEYIEGIEATLVNVVAVAVRKVIGEIDENERIVRIVRNALVTVRNQQHVTIRVAPADEKAVREGSMPASRHSSRRWKTPCAPKSLHSAYRLRGQRRQPLQPSAPYAIAARFIGIHVSPVIERCVPLHGTA